MRFGVLADYAAAGEQGKLTVVHIFDHLRTSPEREGKPLGRCSLVCRVEGSIVDAGPHTFRFALHDGDERPAGYALEAQDCHLSATGEGLPIPQAGDYNFVVTAGDAVLGRIPLHVVQEPETDPGEA